MKKSQLVTHSGKVCSSAGGWQLGNAYLQSAAVFYRGSFLQDFTLRNGSPHRDAHSGAGRSTTTERPLLNVPFVGRGAEVSRLMTLSSLDTLQIVLELAHADAAQLSCQGEHANFQPSSQHVHATGSGICPERFGVWLFSETNGQPFYLRALLQELLEQGVLLPRLIEGRGWVFEPQPSILEATLTSPLRNSARSPSLHRRMDSSPWMNLCRVSCCVSPATGERGGKRFPTTLPPTRSARWSTRRPGMPAGASFMDALTTLEHVHTTDAEPA